MENIGAQKPLQLSSGFSLTTNFYGIDGGRPRQQPFSYFLSGTPTLTLYGISLPLLDNRLISEYRYTSWMATEKNNWWGLPKKQNTILYSTIIGFVHRA
ncbi:MAG TPA: hypothetical protein ENJ95_00875 [Bacteroidetes bacterium]|nr:hypothetical protein [Bacteroidota bacterium]